MSRVYAKPTPIMIPASRTSSNRLERSDLLNSESDSIFMLSLARSNFSFPGAPITPTTSSSFGSSALPFPPQHAPPRQSVYSLFSDEQETVFRRGPVWPTGFGFEAFNEDEVRNNDHLATAPSWTSASSYRGEAVEIHHGAARIKSWAKKAFQKVTPNRWRRAEPERRVRMTLD